MNDMEVKYRNQATRVFSGARQHLIRLFMWLTIVLIAFRVFRNPLLALRKTKKLRQLRNRFRNGHRLNKMARIGRRYFFTYNAPGFPSLAFNRYITHLLQNNTSIHTLLFGITKKCGFKCEHCCEWENLNRPETLSRQDLLRIVRRFQRLGISQLQISGGEPLNRFADILFLLDNMQPGTDSWVLTSGYNLDVEKALTLKHHGLTGITISLDHCEEGAHDSFRGVKGSFQRALHAAGCAAHAGLAICFSICATNAFVSEENLARYAALARESGASFIQILEPKAVGHYANQPVSLLPGQIAKLEQFYEQMNYDDPAFASCPVISYHGYYSRRIGCAGSGKDYVYVDTDGDVHSCPFCRHKLFSALDDDLGPNIQRMKRNGCRVPFVPDPPTKTLTPETIKTTAHESV
jgi:MoaA/NifB/PqqE/SkfB family radical SAM enzyme